MSVQSVELPDIIVNGQRLSNDEVGLIVLGLSLVEGRLGVLVNAEYADTIGNVLDELLGKMVG